MTKNNGEFPLLSHNNPWTTNDNTIWLGSTLTLFRNLEKYKFPGKLEEDRRKQIISIIRRDLLDRSLFQNPLLFESNQLSHTDKEFLNEHYLTNQNFQQTLAGEAFLVDDTGMILLTVNIEDHIQILLIDPHGELENSWTKLLKMESKIGKSLPFAFSTKYGFLTAHPSNCGTGLIATAFLQLPALVHTEKLDEVLQKYADESIYITGIQGNPTEIIGDVLAIQNNFCLGVTEENIISAIRNYTTKLILEENSARKEIKESDSSLIKDHVSRAYGILIHSYQIETVEALNALSLIKLGVEMEWVKGISKVEINQLFFNCRRAHLMRQYPEKISIEELPHRRAEYFHKTLKNAQLVI